MVCTQLVLRLAAASKCSRSPRPFTRPLTWGANVPAFTRAAAATAAIPLSPPQTTTPAAAFSSRAPPPSTKKSGGKVPSGRAATTTDAAPARKAARTAAGPSGKASEVEPAKGRKATTAKSAKATSRKRPAVKRARKVKIRALPTPAQRLQAKARAARAREAARKEKFKAGVRAFKELERSIPKRQSNALVLFRNDNKVLGIPLREANRATLEKWNRISESAKQEYRRKAQANKSQYQSEVRRWFKNLTPEQKTIANSLKFQQTLRRYQARAIRKIRVRAPSVFVKFFQRVFPEISSEVKRRHPSFRQQELLGAASKLAAARWRSLSSEQKKAYRAT